MQTETNKSNFPRVLLADDHQVILNTESQILAAEFNIVGAVRDGAAVLLAAAELNPDVITLDVEMPKMDGVTFLRNLMRLRPMPVVMVSSLTEHGADVTLDALAMGAVDYLPKPKIDLAATLKDYGEQLTEKVKMAARARVRALDPRNDAR